MLCLLTNLILDISRYRLVYPTLKLYVGVIDRFDYLAISSTESDDMMALIMRELKIYPKEESNTARLRAIQKML